MSAFVKVRHADAKWMLRNVKHDATPPDAICVLEMGSALVSGDMDSWSQREWAARWHCSRNKVKRIASALWGLYEGTQYEEELAAAFTHLNAPQMPHHRPQMPHGGTTHPQTNQGVSSHNAPRKDRDAPRKDLRARVPSLTELDRDQDQDSERAPGLFATAPTQQPEPRSEPAPPPPAPQQPSGLDRVAAEWKTLWALRCALGKPQAAGAPRGGSLGKTARKHIATALKAGHTPEDLILVARWAFLAPGFSPKALRGEKPGAPLNEYLATENVYRRTKIGDKLQHARRWEDQGSPVDPHLGGPAPAQGQRKAIDWSRPTLDGPSNGHARPNPADPSGGSEIVIPEGPPRPPAYDDDYFPF